MQQNSPSFSTSSGSLNTNNSSSELRKHISREIKDHKTEIIKELEILADLLV